MLEARSVRLMVGLAVLVATMVVGAASASAFSLSSSTATTQAGAPTDLSFTYVATGAQALSRLDVELPPGVMHDPSSTPTCPVASFQVDRCPASSSVASVATVITVGLAQVSVPGTVFHVADPADDSDFSLGIVLRPPLSALALTRKIYLRGRAVIQGNGTLRHSITGELSSVSVLGVPLRSRISRLRLNFTGRNATGNQTYNSTSCASTEYRATARFTDGTTESARSPYGAIGCDKLIFAGGIDFEFDAKKAQPQSFTVLLKGSARAPAGVTHEFHRSSVSTDISQIGGWDQSALDKLPACEPIDFEADRCPPESAIGSITTSVEGFAGVKRGTVFNSYPRGAKPKASLRIREGTRLNLNLHLYNASDGRSSLEIDGLPQLPLTDIAIDFTAPLFVAKAKPASCSTREARSVISGHSGGWSIVSDSFPAEPCPPSVSIADPIDADSDGDGFADDEIRPENFRFGIIVTAEGQELDTGSARCDLESPDPARAVRGKVRVVRDTGGGYACDVTEAGGPVTVVFSIASIGGHVTVLKMSFTVDRDPPVLTSEAPEIIETDTPNVALDFTFTDDLIAHPQSKYDIECVVEDSSGNRQTTSPGHKYIDTLTLRGGGTCQWELERRGKYIVGVSVIDGTGHVTVLKRQVVFDPMGPIVTFAEVRDEDSDGDGFADDELRAEHFSVKYDVADGGDGIDASRFSCDLVDPATNALADKGKIIVINDGNGGIACDVTEASGPVTVVFSAFSLNGHVTVLTRSYTVDSEAPVIESDAPEPMEFDSTAATLDFTFTDDTIGHPQASYDIECFVEDSSGNRQTTSPGHKYIDPIALRGGGTCQWELERRKQLVGVAVVDGTGHLRVLTRIAVVDAQAPVISLTDYRDMDDDGDGLPDEALRLSSFNVPFSVGGDDDIDTSSFSCKLINPVAMDKDLRVADLDGDGVGDACEVTDAPGGPITVQISAADYRGHVTVLKLAYTVDNEAPTIIGAPGKIVYDRSSFVVEFEFTDDTHNHPQSKFKAGAEIEIKAGYQTSSAKIITDRDTGRSKGFARFESVPDGTHPLTLTIEDSTGHVTVLKRSITVDAEAPVITLADTRDQDSDGDGMADDELRSGDFIVPFRVEDEPGLDDEDVQCSVAQTNPAFQENQNAGQMPDRDNVLFCPVRPPNSGEVQLEITATSAAGHVTVLKIGFTIDAEPPVVTGLDRGFYSTPQVGDEFVITDDTLMHPQSEFKADVELSGLGSGIATVVINRGDGAAQGTVVFDRVPDGQYDMTLTVEDSTGHVTVLKRSITVDAEAPVITLADVRDQDSDGDGMADDELRSGDFIVPFDVEDEPGIDDGDVQCTVTHHNPAFQENTNAGTMPDTPRRLFCPVKSTKTGEVELEITATSGGGHVTVLKIGFTIDTSPPEIISAPDKVVYDLTDFDYEFEFADDTLAHRQSSFVVTCQMSDGSSSELIEGRVIIDRDSGRSKGLCRVAGKSEHNYEMSLRVADSTGHVTVRNVSFTVDATGPAIRLVNPEGIDLDGDGVFDETRYVRSFDRAMSVDTTAGDLDRSSVKCTVRGWNPTTKEQVAAVDLTGDGIPDVCRITDAPDGLHELEVSAADVRGHVTVLKAAITVEATPPVLTILSPVAGQTFTLGAIMPVRTIATSEGPLMYVCSIDSIIVDSSCSSNDSFSTSGLSIGAHTFTVFATDSRGRSATTSVPFNIASPPPPDVCIAIYPPPPGCPGGGISFP